jgi:uncharacterized protein (UPF0276 family)
MGKSRSSIERVSTSIPAAAGIGLRGPHYRDIVDQKPAVGWLEAHSENYFGDGGIPLYYLEKCRAHYPLSLHGVGLSLGSADPLSRHHLQQLKSLIDRFEPGLVSEHLSWGSIDGRYFNDLLPMPYTEESLNHFCSRVVQTQEYLRRQILIENPSSYLTYAHSTIPEWEYFVEIANRSGCGLLVDVNNIYVSAQNHGFDGKHYIEQIPARHVGEIHLAGFTVNTYDDVEILIDDHGSAVAEEVWQLFDFATAQYGPKPSLMEWDSDIPALDALLAEAVKTQSILDRYRALVA